MIHSDLIQKVMRMLLAGEDDVLIKLRKQYEIAEIISEEADVSGFFVNFKVTNFHIKNSNYHDTFQLGDVDGDLQGIDGAVGFVLYIKDGAIKCLEGYTNIVDEWPNDDTQINLVYDSGSDRDYRALKNKWLDKRDCKRNR